MYWPGATLVADRLDTPVPHSTDHKLEAEVPRRSLLLLVGVVTIVGLFLRLPSVDDSLYADELSTYFIVTGHSLGHVIYLLRDHAADLNPPLSFVLMWVTEKLSLSSAAIRLTSLLSGVVAIPLTCLLGLRTVGARAAVVGAALMALSPFLIFYSSEARPYALLMLLVLGSTLALLRALDTRSVRWWAVYAVLACGALYTHYVAVFPLAAQFAWALWVKPEARRPLVVATCASGVGFVPWLPTFLKERHSPGLRGPDVLTPFSLHRVRVDLERFSVGHPVVSVRSLPGEPAIWLIAAGVVVGLLGLGLMARRAPPPREQLRPSAGILLVGLLAVAPPVFIALYSSVASHTIWDANKLIASWPAFSLAVGWLLTRGERFTRLAATALVISGFAVGAVKLMKVSYQRPDYQAAASFIDRRGQSGDPVLDWSVPTPGPLTALDVALDQRGLRSFDRRLVYRLGSPSLQVWLRAKPFTKLPVVRPEEVVRQVQHLAHGRRFFVVAAGPLGSAFAQATGKGFPLIKLRTFPGSLPVSVAEFRG